MKGTIVQEYESTGVQLDFWGDGMGGLEVGAFGLGGLVWGVGRVGGGVDLYLTKPNQFNLPIQTY